MDFGNLSEIISSGVTIIAVFVAVVQLRSSRRSQNEATAKDLYRDYLKNAMDHPKYSLPDFQSLSRDVNSDDFKKYEWYIVYVICV
jgi:hypothetical protein